MRSIGPGNAGCETPGSLEECTLAAAIALANGDPGADVIKFDPTVFQGAAPAATITLSTALPPITDAVEVLGGRCTTGRIDGGGNLIEGPCVELTLNATASTSILTVAASDVTVEGLAFEGVGNGILVEESDVGFTAILKGPAKSSKATTAKFKFSATPASGVKFECKLDARKFAKCKSPTTYRQALVGFGERYSHFLSPRRSQGGDWSRIASGHDD